MFKTLFGKPLPWVAIGLVFLIGHEAMRWREALFGLQAYNTATEFHEIVLQGFIAIFNEIIQPVAIIFVLLAGPIFGIANSDFRSHEIADFFRYVPRLFRTLKTIRKANTTAQQCCGLSWIALRNRRVIQHGHLWQWSALWSGLQWTLLFALSFGTAAFSLKEVMPITSILQEATRDTLNNTIHVKAFIALVLHGYPESVLWSLVLLFVACVSTFAFLRRSDSLLKRSLVVAPAYLICHWLLIYAPRLAGFELALRPCPRIKFAANGQPVREGTFALPEAMFKGPNRCYLLSEGQGTETLLVASPTGGAIDSKLPALFVISKANTPPYRVEASENVLKALISP